jgi:hypothetical protein
MSAHTCSDRASCASSGEIIFRVGIFTVILRIPTRSVLFRPRERAKTRFQAAYAMLVRREGPGGLYYPEVLVLEPEYPCGLLSFRVFLVRSKV